MAIAASNGIHPTGYEDYVMDAGNKIIGMRKGGRFNQSTILTYADGSEWVFLPDKETARFCGFLYLQNALKEAGITLIAAAANKMALHDKKIIYLSQYCGEDRPGLLENSEEISKLAKLGFTDTTANANLRKKEGKLYVFDTEKSSFDSCVHEKIDSFVGLHHAIRSHLEEYTQTTSKI